MTPDLVFEKLKDVLVRIQTISGLDCPPITAELRPAADLKKFDSKIWPVAIGMLADSLGVSIPNDVNIFGKPGTSEPLSIRETVAIVCRLKEKGKSIAAE